MSGDLVVGNTFVRSVPLSSSLPSAVFVVLILLSGTDDYFYPNKICLVAQNKSQLCQECQIGFVFFHSIF